MDFDLYHQAQNKFCNGDFEAALGLCKQSSLKQLEADCLLELKQAHLAINIYEELQCYTQAGFAAILSHDIERANILYKQAAPSSPAKWGTFLLKFLHEANNRQYSFTQDIPSPGYLTFRLYFEMTFSYFLHYELHDYIQRFLDYRNQLINSYPEIIKDIGSAHLARQEYKQALTYLTEAQNHCFEDAGIHFKSAMAHMALNETSQARESLLIVRKMLPGSELVESMLNGLLRKR